MDKDKHFKGIFYL